MSVRNASSTKLLRVTAPDQRVVIDREVGAQEITAFAPTHDEQFSSIELIRKYAVGVDFDRHRAGRDATGAFLCDAEFLRRCGAALHLEFA